MEISKQGSHATLKKLKDEAFIIENRLKPINESKALYPTEKGTKLVRELNKAQNDLFRDIQKSRK